MSVPKLKVTKIDAARRQIETAIRLWMYSADPVSTHTLAAAAHQVLHDIGSKQGQPTILRDLSYIKPEYRKRYAAAFSKAENFFKHADRDAGEVLNFPKDITEIFLLDAVIAYEKIASESLPLMVSFRIWILLNNPDIMEESFKQKLLTLSSGHAFDVKKYTKIEFFDIWMGIVQRKVYEHSS